MNSSAIKIVIVDDEFHARKLLSSYVSKLPFVTLVDAVSNVFEAMNILQNHSIDLLLLDIQMPEVTGLEFARSLKNPPAIIFTTAYSEYAVESYELSVIDYLLKPIAFSRFLQAIDKYQERKNGLLAEKVQQPQQQVTDFENDYITVKDAGRLYKVNYADLIFIEGQREYVTFHTDRHKITALYTLKNLEEKLPKELFVRIHKSYIVSYRHIEMIERHQLVVAKRTLPIGNSYRDELFEKFNKSVL